VGESGAGKSTIVFALMGLIDPTGVVSGQIRFRGQELLADGGAGIRSIRGRDACMVFQDPAASLNPLKRIGTQIAEGLHLHRGLSWSDARQQAVAALGQVGIPAPGLRARDYPHQMSGGMLQRVVIAAALVMRPSIILADEPTSALDTTIQSQIVDLLLALVKTSQTALIFVTHNIALVAEIADRIAVMYSGRLVELGPKARVLDQPCHPYTSALLQSIPRLGEPHRSLQPIQGTMPGPDRIPEGCAFHPRCPRAVLPACLARPPLLVAEPAHLAACHFAREFAR
jgi:oligopeptide/dipeptide ABC transporter ATP-binding protein